MRTKSLSFTRLFKNNLSWKLSWTVAICCVTSLADSTLMASEMVNFQREIQPILAEHCFACHGPDEGARQADLRLDLRDAALAKRESGRAVIEAGNLDASELIRRITSADSDQVMPPSDHKKPLSKKQIHTLKQWITEGANYSTHWAFVQPQRPEIDDNKKTDAPILNPIDHFVAQRLEHEGLSVSRVAPHEILCRRIYLDTIGLPPSPTQIDAFLAASAENLTVAVGALVDQLMQTDQFGEKWARHWLDVARYADSNGFEKDLPREQWAWRDWVIQAINEDMPYDQFLIEQIAGDLLPNTTQDQIVATGFLRNSMINEEGAIVAEQFRMDAMFDRMDCVGKAILGLSIQCCQCHSHKFDPISQSEYYGMFSFLNNTCEAQIGIYTPEQLQTIDQVQKAVHKLNEQLKTENADWPERLAAWEREQAAAATDWTIVDTFDADWAGGLNHPEELPDHSMTILGHPTATGEVSFLAAPEFQGQTALRLEALRYGDMPYHGPGRSKYGTFVLSEFSVESQLPETDTWEVVALQAASADFEEAEQGIRSFAAGATIPEDDKRRVGPVSFLIDGDNGTGWRSDRGPGRRNTESVAVIQFAEPLNFPAGTKLRFKMGYHHSVSGQKDDLCVIGRTRFSLTSALNPQATSYDHAATLALQKPPAEREARDQEALFKAWRQSIPEFAAANTQIDEIWKQFPAEPHTTVFCLSDRPRDLSRQTFALDRGVWDQPTRPIEPHVPGILHNLPADKTSTRLDFARWLASSKSPLTARVQVNRVWQAIFGNGLLQTPEDFGTRAPQPEYLDILDWLSVEFMERGWSNKQLIRTILTSATYQQDSRVTAELFDRDPRNHLLARGPRFRAEAEVVRDLALTAAGLIHNRVGGPSIFPPVPASMLEYNFNQQDFWIPAKPPERYRRALYVFRKRSMPDPVLTAFDAPNADFACARRIRSNTPLAALVSLNEAIFVEAAQAMALRILREGGMTDEERADYAFRLCTSRHSTPAEREELLALLQSRRQRLAEGWISINAVATGDPETLPVLPPETTPQDAAAWTIAARVMLNLDETLSKN